MPCSRSEANLPPVLQCICWVFPLSATETTGTINYMKKGKSLWETHPIEKNRLIYQIGSADPDLALQAAKIVQQDV